MLKTQGQGEAWRSHRLARLRAVLGWSAAGGKPRTARARDSNVNLSRSTSPTGQTPSSPTTPQAHVQQPSRYKFVLKSAAENVPSRPLLSVALPQVE